MPVGIENTVCCLSPERRAKVAFVSYPANDASGWSNLCAKNFEIVYSLINLKAIHE